MRHIKIFLPAFLLFVSGVANAQTVRFHTNLGDIDVALTPAVAPLTVANFLSYLNKGAYTGTIFHRSVSGFVVQGGGFQLNGNSPVGTAQDAPVKNEFNVSNTRGTISMAKLGSDANSATNQWFFNLGDNNSGANNLDTQNGGFTVFGKVVNAAGLAVIDRISAQPVYNLGSPFDSIPLTGYKGNGGILAGNFITVSSIVQVPAVTTGGIQSAASFASSSNTGVSAGEFLALYGQSMGPTMLTTLALDINGAVNTTLAGTRVFFDGTPAPVVYTSAGQVSVIVPYNVAGKDTVRMVVEYQGVQGTGVQLTVASANPAVFTLNSSGTGDGAIVRLDGSIVSSKSPASPGDTLILFGEGQGVTTPQFGDGVIIGSSLPIPAGTFTLLVDGQGVPALYAGGAPSLVNGVLQVNFKVPPIAAGSHQIQLQVGDRISPTGVTLQTK